MDIKIENTKNAVEIAKLNKSIQTWHHENYPNEFKPFNMNEVAIAFEKMLEKEHVIGFIARDMTKPIGYLIAFINTRPESAFQYKKQVLYIDQLAVIHAYRNKGVGQLLMEEAYSFTKYSQITEVQLDYWAGNQLTERFFSKSGFRYFKHKMKN